MGAGMEPPAAGSSGVEGIGRRSAGVSFVACACCLLLDDCWHCNCQVCLQSCTTVHHRLRIEGNEYCRDDAKPAPLAVWCCPKCRCEYTPGASPSEYRCYCGKQAGRQFAVS